MKEAIVDKEFGRYGDVKDALFSELKPIGSGTFGTVYRLELSAGVIAVKVPKTSIVQGSPEYGKIIEEAKLLSKLRHSNITPLLAYGKHPSGTMVFLTEFAQTSLADTIKSGPLRVDHVTKYSRDICKGLVYLHSQSPPVPHRSLKPENVVIFGQDAKLADYGLEFTKEFIYKASGVLGIATWTPPEYFQGKPLDSRGDIHNFGMIIWSMLNGTPPFEKKMNNEVLLLKAKNKVPDIPKDCPSQLSKIIKRCWKTKPSQRITASDLETELDKLGGS